MENIILIVLILNIESSYLQNTENPAESSADTIQFMLIDGEAWRIKTYAIDHDVHVWNLGPMEEEKFNETAFSNTEKHYGDVLRRKIILRTNNGFDGLQKELINSELTQNLEIPKSKAFAFWVSQPNIYKSKSTPE